MRRIYPFVTLILLIVLTACLGITDLEANYPPTQTKPIQGSKISIHDIQGVDHISPMIGRGVKNVVGIVTAVKADSFYMQEPQPDNDHATSEGILVFTRSQPNVRIGDEVVVSGVIDEYYPGGTATRNLSITQIQNVRVEKLSSGHQLQPTVIGVGGRILPGMIVEDDQMKIFDPEKDGLDFYESLESMLVQINNAVVVGPNNSYNEIVVLADEGQNAELRNYKGGIILRENDYNPERIMIDDGIRQIPMVNVGDKFTNPIIGVLDYNYGNYKIQVTENVRISTGNLPIDFFSPAGTDELVVASYNLENFNSIDDPKRGQIYGKHIVDNLKSPDILCLQEIQDNNGIYNDGIVDASKTIQALVSAIRAAGGPIYEYREISPRDDMDGGIEGGNIRTVFLFRKDRGLTFLDKPGGNALSSVEVIKNASGIELSFNPGRIEPFNEAFKESRKPLVGEFRFNGHPIIVIGLHMNSKGGDTPLYGAKQPPDLVSENQRQQQAQVINNFISKVLRLDGEAKIIVLGDLNDFQFSKPLKILKGDLLTDLILTLPEPEQYSYNFEGNSQVLDHILCSRSLLRSIREIKIVHLNSDYNFSERVTDHDPVVARFFLPK